MAPSKWDDDDSDTSSVATGSSPPPPVAVRRGKFDDEEDDIDILDSWDAAEDSEVEREKAKKAAEAKAAADAAAKANKKSKAQRIEDRREENRRKRDENGEYSDEAEDEGAKRARLRKEEKEGDLKHAADLFGDIGDIDDRPIQDPKPAVKVAAASQPADEDLFANIGVNPNRASAKQAVNIVDPDNAANAIDLASLKIFNPSDKKTFENLRTTLAPLLVQNAKKAQYNLFMQEFVKAICREMPSDQIKKVASGLTTLSNEKMKEEKAAEKGGKKTKASKNKTTLNASRDTVLKADVLAYDDGLDDGDFM